MRTKYLVLAAAMSAALASVGFTADEPAPTAQPAAQQAPAQPAAAASSSSTETAAKPAAKETAAAKDSEAEAQEKHLIARGYKKETRNGQTVFCRKEIKTGSHFETKQCGTAESMALAEQQARDLMQNSQNSSGSRVN